MVMISLDQQIAALHEQSTKTKSYILRLSYQSKAKLLEKEKANESNRICVSK